MRLVVLLILAFPALAQEQAVQRALIERDQQSAQFAARLHGAPLAEVQRLENLFAQQLLNAAKDLPQELRPYERQQAAATQTPDLPPAKTPTSRASEVLPLPVKPPGVVDVIP